MKILNEVFLNILIDGERGFFLVSQFDFVFCLFPVLLFLDFDIVFLSKKFAGFRKGQSLYLLDERDRTASLSTAEAEADVLRRTDGE